MQNIAYESMIDKAVKEIASKYGLSNLECANDWKRILIDSPRTSDSALLGHAAAYAYKAEVTKSLDLKPERPEIIEDGNPVYENFLKARIRDFLNIIGGESIDLPNKIVLINLIKNLDVSDLSNYYRSMSYLYISMNKLARSMVTGKQERILMSLFGDSGLNI